MLKFAFHFRISGLGVYTSGVDLLHLDLSLSLSLIII
jgi:hypothetical protein